MKTRVVDKINELLKFAVDNPYSGFYRSKYRAVGLGKNNIELKDLGDIQKLPFLLKHEFSGLSEKREFFVPASQVKGLKYSTGSAGKPHLTFYRKTHYLDELADIAEEKKLIKEVKTVFCMMTAKSVPTHWELYARQWGKNLFVGELSNLTLSGVLVTATMPEMIICPTKKLLEFAKFIAPEDRSRVKFIKTKGDKVSLLQHHALESYFQNAKILKLYTPTDAVSIAAPCPHLLNEAYSYHVSKYSLVEIADIDTNQILPIGKMGEIVVTKFREINPAIPVIRYRTGDFGAWLKEQCDCGKTILKMTGRIGNSIASFGQYIYFRENLENELSAFADNLAGSLILETKNSRGLIDATFYLSVVSGVDDSIKPRIEVCIKTAKLFHRTNFSEVNEYSPDFSVEDLQKKGVIGAYRVVFAAELDKAFPKCRDIVRLEYGDPSVCYS